MADGKNINTKFKEMLVAVPAIQNVVNGQIWLADFHPEGNVFPQICYTFVDNESEQCFPAKHGLLHVWIWVAKNASRPFNTINTLYTALNSLINRDGSVPFDEIDVVANTGLRVVQCVKLFGEQKFDAKLDKYCGIYTYDITVSESEDFTKNGGAVWIS